MISPPPILLLVSSSIRPLLFAGQSEGSGLTETEYTNEGSSDLINNEATDRISNSKNFRSSPGATPHLKANHVPCCSINKSKLVVQTNSYFHV